MPPSRRRRPGLIPRRLVQLFSGSAKFIRPKQRSQRTEADHDVASPEPSLLPFVKNRSFWTQLINNRILRGWKSLKINRAFVCSLMVCGSTYRRRRRRRCLYGCGVCSFVHAPLAGPHRQGLLIHALHTKRHGTIIQLRSEERLCSCRCY